MKISNAVLIYLASTMCLIAPALANDMQSMPPPSPPSDEGGPVVLSMQAKKPGDYNFQATVTAPPKSSSFSGGKLGMIVPVLVNGLKYVDLETGQEIPPPWSKTTGASGRIPPVPIPEPEPEPMPPPPDPPNHGRIMSVGRDPYNPGGYLVTYQDGTVERVSPPAPKKTSP